MRIKMILLPKSKPIWRDRAGLCTCTWPLEGPPWALLVHVFLFMLGKKGNVCKPCDPHAKHCGSHKYSVITHYNLKGNTPYGNFHQTVLMFQLLQGFSDIRNKEWVDWPCDPPAKYYVSLFRHKVISYYHFNLWTDHAIYVSMTFSLLSNHCTT